MGYISFIIIMSMSGSKEINLKWMIENMSSSIYFDLKLTGLDRTKYCVDEILQRTESN